MLPCCINVQCIHFNCFVKSDRKNKWKWWYFGIVIVFVIVKSYVWWCHTTCQVNFCMMLCLAATPVILVCVYEWSLRFKIYGQPSLSLTRREEYMIVNIELALVQDSFRLGWVFWGRHFLQVLPIITWRSSHSKQG